MKSNPFSRIPKSHLLVALFSGAILFSASLSTAQEAEAPDARTKTIESAVDVIDIGTRRELFVDDYLIEVISGAARLQVGKPRDEGIAFKFDNSWEGLFAGYTTVFRDGDLLRAYYRGMPSAGGDGSKTEVTCYAESKDGITWEKPNLGLYEVNGTKENNVILADAAPVTHNFCPFLDTRPNVLAKARYKAVGGTATSGLIGYSSPDGIHWTRIQDAPVFGDSGWVFDSQNVPFWSESEECYVLYYRKSQDGVRAIARATSLDFIEWSQPQPMTYSDTNSVKPSQHLYTNQTQPYFRAPHIYISTAARFMPGRKVLDAEQAKAINVHPKYFADTSDAVLLSSRGDNHYSRLFLEGLVTPEIGFENWVSRTNYPALGIVPTGTNEMSLYVNQNYGQPTSHLRRYSLRLDGLASLRGDFASGELLTKPFIFGGSELHINFATSAAGGVKVEIQDAIGAPLEGFALADCQEQIGNEIDRAVKWKGTVDVSSIVGKHVRLRFVVKDADVYSFQFPLE